MVRDSRRTSKRNRVFPKTAHFIENGPACRVYGTMSVKKVTGNLHIVRVLRAAAVVGMEADAEWGRRRPWGTGT